MTDTWGPYDETDLEGLRSLAAACLEADGGLRILTEDGMLRSRLLHGATLAARDTDGRIVAAASVLVRHGAATTTGLVHPERRREGLGRRLLDWAVDEAGDAPLTVLTETCSPGAEALYASAGLTRTFAELVMRHRLDTLPEVAAPEGIALVPVADADPGALFAAYVGSFSDRPGFPDPGREEWLEELEEDDDWRRDLSLVAFDPSGDPVGFVNVLETWVDQVGVVPALRGHGLGAHLVSRTLAALAAEGAGAAWLTVNVDNPAADLYRSLGFEVFGTRARYAVVGDIA
jgi:mycothiol synthase